VAGITVLCLIVICVLALLYFLVLAPKGNDDDDDSRFNDDQRKKIHKPSGKDTEDQPGSDDDEKSRKTHGHKKHDESPDPESEPPTSEVGLTKSEVEKVLGEFYIKMGAYDISTPVHNENAEEYQQSLQFQADEIARSTHDTEVLNYFNTNKPGWKNYDADPMLKHLQRQYLSKMMKRNDEIVERKTAEQKERERRELKAERERQERQPRTRSADHRRAPRN